MLTRSLAELCALLIDEIHGEIPSRIFAALLKKGRSHISQLHEITGMTHLQLRHGLVVLLQHNLLYYFVDSDVGKTYYEANPDNAYNLIRTGKVLEMVETSYGPPAKDVLQSLLRFGQTRLSDFITAYQVKIEKVARLKQTNGVEVKPIAEELHEVHGGTCLVKPETVVKTIAQLKSTIRRLVEAELIDVVHDRTFVSPADTLKAMDDEVKKKHFPAGVKGAKGKAEYDERMSEGLCKVRDESKSLKRKLEQNGGSAAKLRKLFNGVGTSNGTNGTNGTSDLHEDDDDGGDVPGFDAGRVIRINHEKCLVELRNRRLVQFASDVLGETTSYVYGVLLRLLTKRLSRCQLHPVADLIPEDKDDDDDREAKTPVGFVSVSQMLDNIKVSFDLSAGIGKVQSNQVSLSAAQKINYAPPPKVKIEQVSDSEDDDDDDDDDSGSDDDYKEPPKVNGVKAGDECHEPARQDRPHQLRQHLLLLCESSQKFARHCGEGEFTVDFSPLVRRLQETELDAVIERTAGREGLRLVHVLRAKGKLDEKTLNTTALMKRADVFSKLSELSVPGYVSFQEIPKDSKADVYKSVFLWFSDVDRSLRMLLETSYKSMLRCLQVLEHRRQEEKDILRVTKRTDVKGREKDVMEKSYYRRYAQFQGQEKKLLGTLIRMDDLISILRDF